MDAFRRLGRIFRPVPVSREPRLPHDELEAARVHARWDSLNGRYYWVADVVLDDGAAYRDVTFDADTRIAVSLAGSRIPAALYGRRVTAWLLVEDRTGQQLASAEQRAAFGRQHAPPAMPRDTEMG